MIGAETMLHVQTRRRNAANPLVFLMNNALLKFHLKILQTLKVIRI